MGQLKSVWSIHLLGAFEVRADGRPVSLSTDAQRLVAFLALQGRRMSRALVAGTLWMNGTPERANGSLRSALWRLRSTTTELVEADADALAIFPGIDVDVDHVHEVALSIGAGVDGSGRGLAPLTMELLPGWYDDWVLVERERLHQQALHALEATAQRLSDEGDHLGAIEAALAAIRIDPLRESSHRCLIAVHVAEGNHSDALRQFESYRTLLDEQLGLQPSFQLRDLLA